VAVPPTARPSIPAVRAGFLAVPVAAAIVLVAGATGVIDPEPPVPVVPGCGPVRC
jgi:hypothetical protein